MRGGISRSSMNGEQARLERRFQTVSRAMVEKVVYETGAEFLDFSDEPVSVGLAHEDRPETIWSGPPAMIVERGHHPVCQTSGRVVGGRRESQPKTPCCSDCSAQGKAGTEPVAARVSSYRD